MCQTRSRLFIWSAFLVFSMGVVLAQSTNLPPANDNLLNALKVPRQPSWVDTTSNTGATIEGAAEQGLNHGGVANASASVWYAWSSPELATVLVDTAGSSFDTVIGVYRGSTMDSLESIAQANDVGDRKTAWVKFTAEPNVSYKIAIAGVPPDDQGTVHVRFEINGEPDTTPPIVRILSPPTGTIAADPQVAIAGIAFDPGPNGSGIPEGGVRYSVQSGDFVLADDQPAVGVTNWSATVGLAQGVNTIFVWALDNAGNRSPEQQLQIVLEVPRPANDLFADALLLTGTQGSFTGSNVDATKEAGEPAHGGNEGGRSVWYKFTVTRSGVLLVNTRGSTNLFTLQPLDTVMSVYTSGGTAPPFVTNLQEVASNDDVAGGGGYSEVTFGVEAGQTYYIAVDGYDAASGNIQLNYAFTPAVVYYLQVLPPIGEGTVTPHSGAFPINSTVSLIGRATTGWVFDHFLVNGTEFAENPETLTVTGNLTVQPVFVPRQFAEDFDGPQLKLPWQATNWFVSVDPVVRFNHVFESSGNGLDSLTNIVTLNVRTAGGTAGFDFGTSTETNYDRLEFYVTLLDSAAPDQRLLYGSWSGENRGRFEFFLPPGSARLEWRYSKDLALSYGRDAVFIDNLDLPDALVSSALSIDSQVTTLRINGDPGQRYLIESSSDLRNWTQLGTAQASPSGDVTYREPLKGVRRFYRFTAINPNAP
jgi:hypothetical protein